jgi:hypothetical protein
MTTRKKPAPKPTKEPETFWAYWFDCHESFMVGDLAHFDSHNDAVVAALEDGADGDLSILQITRYKVKNNPILEPI